MSVLQNHIKNLDFELRGTVKAATRARTERRQRLPAGVAEQNRPFEERKRPSSPNVSMKCSYRGFLSEIFALAS